MDREFEIFDPEKEKVQAGLDQASKNNPDTLRALQVLELNDFPQYLQQAEPQEYLFEPNESNVKAHEVEAVNYSYSEIAASGPDGESDGQGRLMQPKNNGAGARGDLSPNLAELVSIETEPVEPLANRPTIDDQVIDIACDRDTRSIQPEPQYLKPIRSAGYSTSEIADASDPIDIFAEPIDWNALPLAPVYCDRSPSPDSRAKARLLESIFGEDAVEIDLGEEKTEAHSTLWAEVKSLARDIIFAAVTAILIVVFVVQPVKVEGTSMLPKLHDGERIFVNKFIYQFESIERGDIVVFWYPLDPSKSFIKRIIGLPGEVVRIDNGKVYINNKPVDEPYLSAEHTRFPSSYPPTRVPDHHYFVMGDNRDASNDSRTWGPVPEKYIYGKAMFRYWPPANVGILTEDK